MPIGSTEVFKTLGFLFLAKADFIINPIERAIITSGNAIKIQTIPSKLLAYKSPRNRMIKVIIPHKLNFFTKEFPKI